MAMELTDAVLMHQFQNGEIAAFDELVGRYTVRLHRFLQRLVLNTAVAEELTQDTFLRVFLARSRYHASASFSTWIYRIATNLALNWIRDSRHARQTSSLDALTVLGTKLQIPVPDRGVEQQLVANVEVQRVRSAIAGLPERQRVAVLLHKYEGQDYEAIARTLDCSVPALKSLLCRAYAVLRGRLQTDAAGEQEIISYREARRRFPKRAKPQCSLPLYIEATYCS